MKRWFIVFTTILLVLIALVSCKSGVQEKGVPEQVSNTEQSSNEPSNLQGQNPVEEADTPAVMQAGLESSGLWIKIDEPMNGTTVNTSPIDLKGRAAIGTTISINDDILYLENNEKFTMKLNLVSGSNLFEIDASDAQGNVVTVYLTVYYEP